jgi:hypothetical protein
MARLPGGSSIFQTVLGEIDNKFVGKINWKNDSDESDDSSADDSVRRNNSTQGSLLVSCQWQFSTFINPLNTMFHVVFHKRVHSDTIIKQFALNFKIGFGVGFVSFRHCFLKKKKKKKKKDTLVCFKYRTNYL